MHRLPSLLIAATLLAGARTVRAESSCVSCHSTLESEEALGHTFQEWEDSSHAAAKVSCEACHGGDASASDAAKAHAGVQVSTEPKSSLYFTAIPGACGKCHAAEAKAFAKSGHAKELARSGRGPNCITCHGSMANRVLAPRELENVCTLCHRKPTDASATIMALNHADAALRRLSLAVSSASAAGLDVGTQQAALIEARRLHRRSLEQWHTFEMREVLRSAQDVTKRATNAINELKLKEQNR